MPTFGFSAFLKVICLNPRPQLRELRNRFRPSTGGYDYHRSLRDHARRLLVENEPMASLQESASAIVKPSERQSVLNSLQWLSEWRAATPGALFAAEPVIYRSPADLFRVRFEPNFGIQIGGSRVAVHIWNTQHPPLITRLVHSALRLINHVYDAEDMVIDDVAVLSIPDRALIRLSDAPALGPMPDRLAAAMERLISDARDDVLGSDRPQLPPVPPL